MKVFDCFMYFDEDLVLDVRLNTLNKYVDFFVIVESNFTHKGDARKLKFDIKKFSKFKNKIIYLVYDQQPKDIYKFYEDDDPADISTKHIFNAGKRENGQRNFISNGLNNASDNDIIIISDIDEIPDLSEVNFIKIKEKILMFRQKMFYYKFNLHLPNLIWTGTKACKKKDLQSPQWLRNIKDRKFPFYRIDTLFSKNKYSSVKFIENGGWHFTNMKSPSAIEHKLKSYLHHREFDENPLSTDEIKQIMDNKRAIYNLGVDQHKNKFGNGNKLQKLSIDKLPKYITENKDLFRDWLD